MNLDKALKLYEECDGLSCCVEYMDSNGYQIIHDKECTKPGPRIYKRPPR